MKQSIIKNASWIIICRIAQAILNLVVTMITARYLGPSNYGLITYAASLVSFVIPIVQLGINCILVQQFVDYPEDNGRILGTTTMLTSISSLMGIIGVGLFAFLINYNEIETITVVILYSISMLFQMTEMIQYWYQSKLLSKYVSIVSLISRAIVSVYKIYIIISGKNIYWFAIVNSVDFLIISVSLYVIYFKLGGKKILFSLSTAKRILSKSKYFVCSGLMVSIYSYTDKIMLKLMSGDTASGYYSAATTCAGMSIFVFTAVADSFRPVIFENKKTNPALYERNMKRLYCITFYMALAQSVVFSFFAEPIILLLYGLEYLPSAPILRIVTWCSMFSYIGNASYTWFLSENKEKYILIINLIGAFINLVGNLILIPMLGVYGAAIISVITQIIINFILVLILKPICKCGKLILSASNPMVLHQLFANRGKIK